MRDKDAAVAALLFAELAATVKDRKQTVLEYLDDLYIDVGHYGERLVTKFLEGREGLARINQLMAAFRGRPPQQIGGLTITEVYDYETSRDPHLERQRCRPSPAPALRRPPDLSHRAARHPIRRPALRDRAQDQVLPLRTDARGRSRPSGERQARNSPLPRSDDDRS